MNAAPYETTTALLGPPKGPVLAQKGPFGSPGGPWAAPGGLIWAQVPLDGPTGWAAFISCARAPYEITTALLEPTKRPPLAQKGPFGSPGGPWAALGDLIWAQLPLVGPTGWATWLGCYMYSLGHIGPPFQPQGPQMGYLAPI